LEKVEYIVKKEKRSDVSVDWESLLQECRLEDLPPSLEDEIFASGDEGAQALSRAFLFIPWAQIVTLRTVRAPLSAVFVYLVLWRLRRMRRRRTVVLTSGALAPFGLTRWDKHRALVYLEAKGLLTVTRSRGRNPLVTLTVDTPPACTERSA